MKLHSVNESSTYQIAGHLYSSSVLGHYHPTVLVLLWRGRRTRALVQPQSRELIGSQLFRLQGHGYDISSILQGYMPPSERVIVERRITNSEVTTRIPETPTLKLLECVSALSDVRKIHNSIGIILQISGTVDRHLHGTELSEDRLQPFAIVDDRHMLVNCTTTFIPNDREVEVKNQDARGLQTVIPVCDIRFLASVPIRAAPDIRRVQVRLVQALMFRGSKMIIRCNQTLKASHSRTREWDSRME